MDFEIIMSNNNDIENNLNQSDVSLLDTTEKKELQMAASIKLRFYTLGILVGYIIFILLNVITFIILKESDVKTLDSFIIVLIADLLAFAFWYRDLRVFVKI